MRKALDEAGYDDIPGNGLYVIGGLALGAPDIPLSQLIKELRISKQAAGAVGRCPGDARLPGALGGEGRPPQANGDAHRTGKGGGRHAAGSPREIDAELMASVGEDDVKRTRRTLAVLIDIGQQAHASERDDL